MLYKIRTKWIEIAHLIGNLNARIILTLFYFTLFLLPSIALTYFSKRIEKKIDMKKESYFNNERLKMKDLVEGKKQW